MYLSTLNLLVTVAGGWCGGGKGEGVLGSNFQYKYWTNTVFERFFAKNVGKTAALFSMSLGRFFFGLGPKPLYSLCFGLVQILFLTRTNVVLGVVQILFFHQRRGKKTRCILGIHEVGWSGFDWTAVVRDARGRHLGRLVEWPCRDARAGFRQGRAVLVSARMSRIATNMPL